MNSSEQSQNEASEPKGQGASSYSDKWTIYCHTHIVTGRRYVGLTKKRMLQRWNEHVYNAQSKRGKGCRHFWNAIRKYGKDAFLHEILAMSWDLEGANATERIIVEQWDTRNPEFGFNLALGGSHIPHPVKNPWDCPEFREKGLTNLAKANASLTTQQRSQNAKNLWSDPEYSAKVTKSSKKAWSDPFLRINQSESQRIIKARPEIKKRQVEASRELWRSETFRAKNANLWNDPRFRSQCQSGLVRGAALNSSKTHCNNGHEYSSENTYITKSGSRVCRICARERGKIDMRAARARKKTGSCQHMNLSLRPREETLAALVVSKMLN